MFSLKDFGFEPSIHWYEHDSEKGACITGGAFIPSNIGWPSDFEGAYVYGEYKLGGIYRISPGGEGCPASDCKTPISSYEETLVEFSDATATVSMGFGPYAGGTPQALYFLSRGAGRGSSDKDRPEGLVRISYSGVLQTNDRPNAAIDTDLTVGFNPLTVRFDGTGSTDPDGEDSSLKFAWDYDGDGKIDSTSPSDSFVYKDPGVYEATLTVTDAGGATDKMSVDITVDNSPPVPVIESPSADVAFAVGDSIRLVGSATDSEDGALPSSSFTWELREHHGDHYHTIMEPKAGNTLTYVMRGPVGFEAIESSYLEALLTATDSRGLSSTAVRILRPKLLTVKLDSSPSGLDVMVHGQPIQTPTSVVAWENQSLDIGAVGDKSGSYQFESWSDGGEREHTFIASPSQLDIVAYFEAVEATETVETVKEEEQSTSDEPATTIVEKDEDEEVEAAEGTASTMVSESDADSITAELLDFAVILIIDDADGYRNRKLGQNKKSPAFPYLNENLKDIVSEWLRKYLKSLVNSSGLPYAKPVDVNLTRKKKKGHDDGKRYEVTYGGTVTFKKKKEDQYLPTVSIIQKMQKQALTRVGDKLVDDIEDAVPGVIISSVVTEIVYTDGEQTASQVQGETPTSSADDGNNKISNSIIMIICFVVAGIGIVAISAFFIIRQRSTKSAPPPPPKKKEQTDLNETGDTAYAGYDL